MNGRTGLRLPKKNGLRERKAMKEEKHPELG